MADDYYKFLKSEHIDFLLRDGVLRFGNLEHYRKLEIETGDDHIGDRNEGLFEYFADEVCLDVNNPNDQEMVRRYRAIGALPRRVGMLWDVGSQYIVSNSACVFCLSKGNLEALSTLMCNAALKPEYRYDACVRIKDPKKLGQAIVDAPATFPYGLQFERLVLDQVRYIDPWADISNERFVEPGLFVKHPKYAYQCESRFALQPPRGTYILNASQNDKLLIEYVEVRVAKPAEHFEEVFRNRELRITG